MFKRAEHLTHQEPDQQSEHQEGDSAAHEQQRYNEIECLMIGDSMCAQDIP